jgi:hypothetical protein
MFIAFFKEKLQYLDETNTKDQKVNVASFSVEMYTSMHDG